jgi:inosose dehydratase
MKVKLGCQPLTWGKDFEQAARDIAAIGFSGVEAPVGRYLDVPDDLKKLLDETGLQVSSTYCGGSFELPEERVKLTERIVKIAALLPQFGCDRVLLAPGQRAIHPANEKGELRDEVYERFADGVNECARQCYEKYGVKSVFHNHAWLLIESPREVDLFMEMTDPVFVLAGFDTAQLAYGGYEPAEAFRKWKDRIGYVHLKDNNKALPTAMPVAEKNALRDSRAGKRKKFHVFAPLGQGALGDSGQKAVLDALREIDYQGWIVSELDSSDKSPKEANAENFSWLQSHLKAEEVR